MRFKDWRIWMKSLPWYFKWFPLFILFRPIVDSFYWMKEVSPLLSPANIIGITTPLLVIWAFTKTQKSRQTAVDKRINVWFALLLASTFMVILMNGFVMLSLEQFLKMAMPVYVFLFLRRFIRSEKDLDGVLQTLIFSLIFVAPVLLYEVAVGPIRVELSRHLERSQGLFGDVVSYGMYVSFALLSTGYFYVKHRHNRRSKKQGWLLIVAILLGVLGLTNIHHIASYVVFISVLLILSMFVLKTKAEALIPMIVFVLIIGGFVGDSVYQEKINPLFAEDIEVFEGKEDSSKLFHGRMGRWEFMADYYTQQHVFAQFFGFPYSFINDIRLIGPGSHSDYARIIYTTGYVGIVIYLSLLVMIYRRSRKLLMSKRFLVLGALAILLLYSVSITPTYYPPFMYIIMSIFAFVALPIKKKSIAKT